MAAFLQANAALLHGDANIGRSEHAWLDNDTEDPTRVAPRPDGQGGRTDRGSTRVADREGSSKEVRRAASDGASRRTASPTTASPTTAHGPRVKMGRRLATLMLVRRRGRS